MRKKAALILLSSVLITLCYLTIDSAKKILRSDSQKISSIKGEEQQRLVLITQDLDTPFWDGVAYGAAQQAEKEQVSLEVWGSYNNNEQDFLKKIDIAIQSKVDGLILQGLDTDEFKEMTKVKASFHGIPVITVANDVPMTESLRKTYVGSDQLKAGEMLAANVIQDMGISGNVVLLYDSHSEFYQEERLRGIQKVLSQYQDIKVVLTETAHTREPVIAATQDVLNHYPEAKAFIAVNGNMAGPMIQEISKRFQIKPMFLYTFDDGPELQPLLEEEKLDGIVKQDPEMMGKIGVQRLLEWLDGETVPLNINGYYTDIHIVKAGKEQ
ncbi:sugar ABC transporter substrate-binding protein [Cytobacillus gottheilii]|uniref:sugar ABC transporter substrate-binding protein n=1 Tax=Cytobacillus gottheilii TaxID=859144 RepID=UPI0009BBED5C|nr:sugar ABC transporter substrate-binding protein [Cytobacillus gottheilii]